MSTTARLACAAPRPCRVEYEHPDRGAPEWQVVTARADAYGNCEVIARCGDRDIADLIVRLVNAEPAIVATLERARVAFQHVPHRVNLSYEGGVAWHAQDAIKDVDRALALLRDDAPATRPAADPEVVSALEAALPFVEDATAGPYTDQRTQARAALDQIRAALAKVRG